MKSLFTVIFGIVLFPQFSSGQVGKRPGNVLAAVFDGRSPCQEMAAQLNEKTIPECIKIKWRLVLYKDSLTGAPDVYELYGFIYRNSSPRIGKWKIGKGTHTDPDATVYELEYSKSPTLLLMKADEGVLFWLDKERKLMVGNADFSYTLNRTQHSFADLLKWQSTRMP